MRRRRMVTVMTFNSKPRSILTQISLPKPIVLQRRFIVDSLRFPTFNCSLTFFNGIFIETPCRNGYFQYQNITRLKSYLYFKFTDIETRSNLMIVIVIKLKQFKKILSTEKENLVGYRMCSTFSIHDLI